MPRLQQAIREGASGVLHSTIPPITPAAWTTFLTGKQPGSHGIIDFERFDVHANRLALNSTRCLDHVRNIWQILSDKGYKVGSINVPMTYPPVPVNGFMISGFETPGPQAQFAYPPELRQEVLKQWSDPTLQARWKRKWFGGDALFKENVDYFSHSFHQAAAMTRFCGDKYGWGRDDGRLQDDRQHPAQGVEVHRPALVRSKPGTAGHGLRLFRGGRSRPRRPARLRPGPRCGGDDRLRPRARLTRRKSPAQPHAFPLGLPDPEGPAPKWPRGCAGSSGATSA